MDTIFVVVVGSSCCSLSGLQGLTDSELRFGQLSVLTEVVYLRYRVAFLKLVLRRSPIRISIQQ